MHIPPDIEAAVERMSSSDALLMAKVVKGSTPGDHDCLIYKEVSPGNGPLTPMQLAQCLAAIGVAVQGALGDLLTRNPELAAAVEASKSAPPRKDMN